MALPNVNFIIGANGLGAVAPGQDYISGLVFYSASLPSGFSSSAREKQFFSISDAVSAGITGTSSDETKAVAKLVIGGTPAVGDTYKLVYTGIKGAVTIVDTYTLVTADAVSVTTAASKLKDLINAGTATHGFTATSSTGTILITTKAGEGIFPNSGTPYSGTVTGGSTFTFTQPTGSGSTVLGVASVFDVMYYHISEYFRLNPTGNLWVGIYSVPSPFTGAEVITLQNASNYTCRQIGVYYTNASYATSQVTSLQTQVTTLASNYKWTTIQYAGDISAVTDLSTLGDLSQLTASGVSVVIGQDANAQGAKLYSATGKTISCLGAVLGAVSSANVNDSIAYPAKFNFSNGIELDVIGFGNGQTWKALDSSSPNLFTTLDNYNYIFLRKFVGVTGSFANGDYTAITRANDYAYISRNRVIQKAQRLLYTAYVYYLNFNNLVLNADGTISENSASGLEAVGSDALSVLLQTPTAISGQIVSIPRNQKPLTNSTLNVTVRIQPKPNAAFILITIGYVATLS